MHNPFLIGGLALLAWVATWLGTWHLRRLALRHDRLDEVNERSSHIQPTPRGGGLSIVLVMAASIAAAPLYSSMPTNWAWSMTLGGLLVALIGFVDDLNHVAARYRLAAHFGAASLVVWTVGSVTLDWIGLGWPPFETFVSVVMIVWLINLFNFMDGIDGIASSEAICVWIALALIAQLTEPAWGLTPLAILAAASIAGFLVWNRPPARIFMGDVCSGFLGFVLGSLVVAAWQTSPHLGIAGLILLAVFVTDATVTLLVRLMRRERIYEAHRSHAYQILARRWDSHRKVTIAAIFLTLGWLLPLAYLVAAGRLQIILGLLAAYVPLACGALAVGAGRGQSN